MTSLNAIKHTLLKLNYTITCVEFTIQLGEEIVICKQQQIEGSVNNGTY